MKKRGSYLWLAMLLILAARLSLAEQLLWKFSEDSLSITKEGYHITYSGLPSLNINSRFSLPIKTVFLEIDNSLTEADFCVNNRDQIKIGFIPPQYGGFDNSITGTENITVKSQLRDKDRIQSPIYGIESFKVNGKLYAAVSILPVTIDDKSNIIFNRVVSIKSPIVANGVVEKSTIISNIRSKTCESGQVPAIKAGSASNPPLGNEYVIVTTGNLAPSFEELSNFKNATGISTAIAALDSIYAHYSGIDKPEQIRNYLKDFYQAGGRYVLLGGDDLTVPVRYVYYYNTNSAPNNPYHLMPSDLYYADLNGDWDVDGDGIWGEPAHDSPDLSPELIVGRLPLKTAESAQNYIDKLIKYATNPGDGDFNYLTKSLFFSSDEMRDYPSGGQHHVIANEIPPSISIDTVFGVEAPSGHDPSPTNPDGESDINKISEGFGFIHIIAHGRVDGFIVKSANYRDWPASLILTAPQIGGHGSVVDLKKNDKTSLYYSLSCNVGGYDLDTIGGECTDWSMVERLISSEASGAIGMVANSRWGWVYSSYYLQEAFTKHLYGEANGSPAMAMYYSWIDCPYYRDLIYGQNYFGDPTLRIYLTVPDRLDITTTKSDMNPRICLTSKNTPVSNATVTLSLDGDILEKGVTNQEGCYTFTTEIDYEADYIITATKEGYTVAQETCTPSLILSTDENTNSLPAGFALEQNFPNPFNPTTHIEYCLSAKVDVTIEIINTLGRSIRTITSIEQPAGHHTIVWNGTDELNRQMPSGVYFYRLKAGNFHQTKKMLLLR